jgi:membrane protein insertase Oxa1/YidC/SpoIIIJ
MNKDERDEAMANEISALYKKNGYHLWTGWIPAALTLVFIILLYSGIKTFTPDGLYALTFKTRNTIDLAGASQFVWTVLGVMVGTSLLTPIWNAIISVIKAKRQQQSVKNTLIATLISSAIGIGLSVWIASSVTMSTAIAIATFYTLSFFETIVTTSRKKTDDQAQ